ncbi:hypothetical protein DTL42_19335 [Bremerella cremea]|uniref:Uncharacterized protein n=1 Tax=Bremerella cremea TaxID=1031537 RepID=A0A368KQQ9_9BACT|nr:hypothetical protein [Bremerella cremea]RCS42293.1 hypothetical protein DTL42_19335 [Bremerella cremea]
MSVRTVDAECTQESIHVAEWYLRNCDHLDSLLNIGWEYAQRSFDLEFGDEFIEEVVEDIVSGLRKDDSIESAVVGQTAILLAEELDLILTVDFTSSALNDGMGIEFIEDVSEHGYPFDQQDFRLSNVDFVDVARVILAQKTFEITGS